MQKVGPRHCASQVCNKDWLRMGLFADSMASPRLESQRHRLLQKVRSGALPGVAHFPDGQGTDGPIIGKKLVEYLRVISIDLWHKTTHKYYRLFFDVYHKPRTLWCMKAFATDSG